MEAAIFRIFSSAKIEWGMDEFDQLTVDLARNICSIQFIKQKLVLDTKEQMKDSFVSKLLTEKLRTEITFCNMLTCINGIFSKT